MSCLSAIKLCSVVERTMCHMNVSVCTCTPDDAMALDAQIIASVKKFLTFFAKAWFQLWSHDLIGVHCWTPGFLCTVWNDHIPYITDKSHYFVMCTIYGIITLLCWTAQKRERRQFLNKILQQLFLCFKILLSIKITYIIGSRLL